MLSKVQKNVTEWNMIAPGDVVLAAVSGGADSVSLLLVLEALKKELPFTLMVVHVEHGIRGEESLQDALFVEDLCKRMGLSHFTVPVDAPSYSKTHGIGLEEAARILRYEVFEQIAREHNAKVALAHHMEDNAETILFQMTRGSGLTGVCGMKPVRKETGVVYIRPLLTVHREEIECFLKAHGMGWRQDSTNQEVEYSRNYVRHMVMPHLEKLNDQAVEHINQTALHLLEIRDYLEMETAFAWDKTVSQRSLDNGMPYLCVSVENFRKCHRAIQKEIIMKMIAQMAGSKKDIANSHVEDILALCEKQSGKEIHLPYGLIGKRVFDELLIIKEDHSREELFEERKVTGEELVELLNVEKPMEISLGGDKSLLVKVFSYDFSTIQIPQKTYTKWMDYDRMKQGFCIRTRQNGDYFVSDALGHHKKLQNYFVDEKISVQQREKMLLLAQGSHVLWLIGGRISESMKVTETTKHVVELEYIGG